MVKQNQMNKTVCRDILVVCNGSHKKLIYSTQMGKKELIRGNILQNLSSLQLNRRGPTLNHDHPRIVQRP